MEPPNSPKIRLMCSYGGHIVPRPHDKNLFYAAGDTRIIAVDRRSIAAGSISALKSQISRAVFNNRPFHLKYQLPNLDLDSLISVVTDEDVVNLIDEYDRISRQQCGRIRLFLFPIKAESLNSGVFCGKSENWFCDDLKNTRSLQEEKVVGVVGGAESLVLETSSSFGSTGSSLCVSNTPPVGGGCEETAGLSLLDTLIRVHSSASIESDYSVGVAGPAPKTETCKEEPLIQVDDPEPPSFVIEAEKTAYNLPISVPMQSGVQVLGYPVSQQPDGKKMQYETPIVHGCLQYVPQYPVSSVPMPSYYPYYQMPVQQQQIPCTSSQQCPIYFVPVRPAQYHNISNPYNFIDTTYTSRPTLYPQTAVISPPFVQKELFGVQTIAESVTMVHRTVAATTPLISIPSNQGQLMTGFSEQQNLSEPVTSTSVASSTQSSELDEDIVYNQIYKTQPLAPLLASHYQEVTKGVNAMLPESSAQMQANHAKQQAAVHPL